MMKLSRSECPKWFADKIELWTQYWINKVNNPNSKNNWDWYDIEGIPTNQKLLPLLLADTKIHCSYCDKRPSRVKEIDHFRPKVAFPDDAFNWENLFVVCKDCNYLKLNDYNDLILKPDELEYEFNRFFCCNEDGFLEPISEENTSDYLRAKETIEKLKLNEEGLPEARKQVLDAKSVFQNYNIDLVPFRFIFTQ